MKNYPIDEKYISDFIDAALDEDVKSGDITALACIPSDKRDRAVLKVKADGVLAGIAFAERVFKKVDPSSQIKIYLHDGDHIKYGDIAFEVECQTQALLKAERLVLNTMQRMSGIATMSQRFLQAVEGFEVKILDTRKTTPLFRYFEKWAVKIGGCENYRIGLYDWFMIKDNHNDAAGGILPAIERVEAFRTKNGWRNEQHVGLTVEVRNLEELQQVLDGGKGKVTRIMLDNFTLPLTRKAVKMVNKRFEVEASGGVTLKTVRKIAATGVDFISAGALTHSALSLDLSLKVVKN
jgi:nicotinate-nucleotide pyrophosphorylase (carboxylating)